MSKHLYKARTHDSKMFLHHKKNTCKDIDCHLTEKMKKESEKHYTIALRFKDHLLLFLNQFVYCGKTCWKRKEKFSYLYEESCEKIDAQFNVIKILKHLKRVKIVVKNSLMTP